jgi:serine O-acetyltransferase
MSRLSEILDADWARLGALAGTTFRQRRLVDAFSPRFAPVALVRAAQCLHRAGWARLAKLPALLNFVLFGLEVPPRLPIGPGLVLMHTHGTVLGAASIGANVTLYQQVTLGAIEMDFAYTLHLRPVVEDEVVISAGAKVLGSLTLGRACVVGANAVVLKDVPPQHVAVGVPARHLPPKDKRPLDVSGLAEPKR